ncbi:hypothetical protein CDR68_24120 [Salmonella enterica]|nr:hypothetical protein [Salmonella enterica]
MRLASPVVEITRRSLEAALWLQCLTPEYDLLSAPLCAATDFTDLAGYCDHVAVTLIECRDPVLKMALCERLSASLALLWPTLNGPLPPHLTEYFTVETLPDTFPRFEPGAELLCDYCQALVQILTEQTLTGKGQNQRARNWRSPEYVKRRDDGADIRLSGTGEDYFVSVYLVQF